MTQEVVVVLMYTTTRTGNDRDRTIALTQNSRDETVFPTARLSEHQTVRAAATRAINKQLGINFSRRTDGLEEFFVSDTLLLGARVHVVRVESRHRRKFQDKGKLLCVNIGQMEDGDTQLSTNHVQFLKKLQAMTPVADEEAAEMVAV